MTPMTDIAAGERFRFACHPGVPCFTECCRMLELALHPYDFVLLRRATGLGSAELFERYILEEDDPRFPLPRHYLAMVDDGRASCPFVGASGCGIYSFRPSACRSYPLGRAAVFAGDAVEERFVLVKEAHCRGFESGDEFLPAAYLVSQELTVINRVNDAVARLMQRPEMRHFTASIGQKRLYVLAMCQTDVFRERLARGDFADFPVAARGLDDADFLVHAAAWLGRKFFPV